MNIAIITCVIPSLVPLTISLFESAEKNKSGNNNINWYYISSVSDIEEIKNFKKIAFCEVNVQPSFNHGSSLNLIKEYNFKEDIIIILDCDVKILIKNWDEIIVEKLKTYNVMSVTLSDNDIPRNNDLLKTKPSVYFLAFKSEYFKNIKIDFRPLLQYNKNKNKNIVFREKINGVKIKKDTGYSIGEKIKDGEYFCLKNKVDGNEVQLWFYEDRLFAIHIRNSRKKSRRKLISGY